ncbi:MAG: cation-translocating P-type ATPase [Cyanobacteria bacterium HKST-UBA06]|nr:cation-translocating P-type ATPase [Cyanobacteria bacterium HKST-UBA06]
MQQNLTLHIHGMTCAGCEQTIRQGLEQLDGVEEVAVSVSTNDAQVAFDDSTTSLDTIARQIGRLGYRMVHAESFEGFDHTSAMTYVARLGGQAKSALTWLGARTIFCAALTLAMWLIPHRFGIDGLAICSTVVLIIGGGPMIMRAIKAFGLGSLTMDTLVSVGTLSAWGYSILAAYGRSTLGLDLARQADVFNTPYFVTVATLITIVLLGRLIEQWAQFSSQSAVRKLVGQPVAEATRIGPGGDEVVALDAVVVGDRLRVKSGQRVPLDGTVVAGSTEVDESLLTGESLPVPKTVDSRLIGGSINLAEPVEMVVTHLNHQGVLHQVVSLVLSAQRSKPPVQRLADEWSKRFVMGVFAVALLTFILWTLFAKPPQGVAAEVIALNRMVSVLMIACPCALGLATPVAVVMAISQAARQGVLVKQAASLEQLVQIDTVVFDKTGTLTAGGGLDKYHIDFVMNPDLVGMTRQDALFYLGSLEQGSPHPFARLITRMAHNEANRGLVSPDEFRTVDREGIGGKVDGVNVWCGNQYLLDTVGVAIPDSLKPDGQRLSRMGRSLVYGVVDGQVVALVGIGTALRSEAADVIATLKSKGHHVVLLTGDMAEAGQAVADALGIAEVISNVAPDEKREVIKTLQDEGKRVMMLGDGLNDAAALAQADVGVAVDMTSDIAAMSSDVAFLTPKLSNVLALFTLAQRTRRVIRQNLMFAFAYNVVAIPVAAGVLVPVIGVSVNPMVAGLAMAASSIIVIFNSLKLRL